MKAITTGIYGLEKLNPILGFVSFLQFFAAAAPAAASFSSCHYLCSHVQHRPNEQNGKTGKANFFSSYRGIVGTWLRTLDQKTLTQYLKSLNINIHNVVMKLSFHGVTKTSASWHETNAIGNPTDVRNFENKKKLLLKRCQNTRLCNET
ncbi:CLUMA_CG005782, isoform A [Clunio marinus]|uniref:CLUMA_CG005782, isoform A n=1 Tax=Clunio marinus TaxID=568069 RepID=A0A1J1I0A3_9DIPT|nr:CLUMA_CG005782, isoform A [Clunio marinus]